jgi:hypothetical protein
MLDDIIQVGGSALTQAHTAAPQGYVFGATEGEHLLHFRDGGKICIKVGPCHRLRQSHLGVQQAGRCGHSDPPTLADGRTFYVLEGSGIFTLNDARDPFEKGGTIFIPKIAWNQSVAALAVSYVLPILLLPIVLYLIRLRA